MLSFLGLSELSGMNQDESELEDVYTKKRLISNFMKPC